nr:Phage minor tail protein L [uncultured Mediterranean phage uvMED]BAR24811.1 Phage minor tail protein L [uncultured Mediterranean phage uvMED]BAR24830.1 Phage minor tail protein L [uncultured Mediterranean phage uvMED]BAR24890.1 Phage minor tail protein L [uncultured Mediterranean phage uvMED]
MAFPYTLHAWSANREYKKDDVVRANPAKSNTLAFRCIKAGTSDTEDVYENFANKEPAFPFKIATELIDGTVTWESFEPLAEELLRLEPTAVIDLFEVELTAAVNGVDDTLRYHAGLNGITETIKFGGVSYPAVPVEVDGFEFSAKGTLPRPTLRVANISNAITSLMLTYDVLAAEVRRIRTFVKFIDTSNFNANPGFTRETDVEDFLLTQGGDTLIEQSFNDTADPDAKIVETWYIDRVANENLQFVEFELAPKIDLTNLAIPRRTIEEFCPWKYRGTRCGYKGDSCFTVTDQPITGGTLADRKAADSCGKRLSSCRLRFGTKLDLPFGGFVGARLQA